MNSPTTTLLLLVAISSLARCQDVDVTRVTSSENSLEPKRENANQLVDSIVKLIRPKYRRKLAVLSATR